jgi:hypothetical protein
MESGSLILCRQFSVDLITTNSDAAVWAESVIPQAVARCSVKRKRIGFLPGGLRVPQGFHRFELASSLDAASNQKTR